METASTEAGGISPWDRQPVGFALALLRRKAGLFPDALSEPLGGATRNLISSYESGRYAPSYVKMRRMLDTMGCTLRDLQDAIDEVKGRAPRDREVSLEERILGDLDGLIEAWARLLPAEAEPLLRQAEQQIVNALRGSLSVLETSEATR